MSPKIHRNPLILPGALRHHDQVGTWWADTLASTGDRPLRLRVGYLIPARPTLATVALGHAYRHAPAKQLAQFGGIAIHLHLVALYEQQLANSTRRSWEASPLAKRSKWEDKLLNDRLELSWASLTLPYDGGRRSDPGWRRSRTEKVASGRDRLIKLELLDRKTNTLQREDRPWRGGVNAPRTYQAIDRRERHLDVPSALFTSGDYVRLSGVAIHTLLVELAHDQLNATETALLISRGSLRPETRRTGLTELNKSLSRELKTALPRLARPTQR